MEWQPIETAPKDGTWVLLIGGKTGEDVYLESEPPSCLSRPVVAFWKPLDDILFENNGYWAYDFWDGSWRSTYDEPTHWMPLPPPPLPKEPA